MDGRISADRIAQVIKRCNPDVVALQELDVGRLRSSGIHQAQSIAKALEMSFHFHPSFSYKDEQYGNAILSRYPMTVIKKDALPRLWGKVFMEPRIVMESRGAIWVTIEMNGVKINIINTHLSIWASERVIQIKTHLSPDWLQHPDCHGPTILCGDMNMVPGSPGYKSICKRLQDSQLMLTGHTPVKTWFAGYAFRCIDHIFVTPDFSVHSIEVAHTALDRWASDHLPLIAGLGLKPQIR
jgi:endonuclease/exonuclease/phosphatase family metal-dependent hydrolase